MLNILTSSSLHNKFQLNNLAYGELRFLSVETRSGLTAKSWFTLANTSFSTIKY